jgi:hypothetical protein
MHLPTECSTDPDQKERGYAMNTAKFTKLFQLLVTNGLSVNEATKVAVKVSSDDATPIHKTRALQAETTTLTVKEQVMQFADRHGRGVWKLQGVARALNLDPNAISPQLTKLVKEGRLTRTGLGEYRKL